MSYFRTFASVVVPSLLCVGAAASCGTAVQRVGATPDGGGGEDAATATFGTVDPDASDGGANCAATVAETTKAKVDIIFVIDSSGSMDAELTQIRTNVNAFAAKIGGIGLDYTVTFVVEKGRGRFQVCVPEPLAGPDCADKPPTFHHVDRYVDSWDSFDRILETYETSWKAYVRQDAVKVFIEVTDDRSTMSFTDFDEQLLAKQPAGVFGTAARRNYIFHSIVSKPAGDPVPSENRCPGSAGASLDYQQLSQLTGGIVEEVCKTDYSSVLDNIAKGITDRLSCELAYPSSAESDPTKLAVTFTPKDQPQQRLTQITDESKCDTVPNAWYYDEPVKPSKIILCPSTCTMANSSPDAKLEALVGCQAGPPS